MLIGLIAEDPKMKCLGVLVFICVFMFWENADASCNGMRRRTSKKYPQSCSHLRCNAPSGVYIIKPRGIRNPIRVYCEQASTVVGRRAFTFLPRSITRRSDAQRIVNSLFRDRKNVLLKLQRKTDRSEAYTLIQPHSNHTTKNFKILINGYNGYTRPQNDIMRDYIFFGILPKGTAKVKSLQGFKSNGKDVSFNNCDANPNSLFAFLPNHNLQKVSGSASPFYERHGVAVEWRKTARPITSPDRMMPNEFFFLTEVHFGGCGTYTSSDRWIDGYHATAIGIR